LCQTFRIVFQAKQCSKAEFHPSFFSAGSTSPHRSELHDNLVARLKTTFSQVDSLHAIT